MPVGCSVKCKISQHIYPIAQSKVLEEGRLQVIISHTNTDFDAFASMLAAKKLYPDAVLVLSDKQTTTVKQFLNIYRDTFHFVFEHQVDWEKVTKLIMVDVASLKRTGNYAKNLSFEDVEIIVYDHHPPGKNDVKTAQRYVEPVGAAVTLLVEEMQRKNIPIDEFEATIFGLGIYTDTGNFTYQTTTARDLKAASFLLECGMNLEMIQRFSQTSLLPEQRTLLDHLFMHAEIVEIEGLLIVLTKHELEQFQGGLATLTQRLMEMKGSDACISVVKMKHHVYIVGRANADRINLLPLLRRFGGGGHQHAGSATVKRAELEPIYAELKKNLDCMLQPAVTARHIMTVPVKTITSDTTIEKASQMMYRYGHSGYPIVENDELVGIITRRDLDKANHHGLGHAPVKAYMTTNVITIHPDMTLEEIQKIIIEHNIGRLPVVENGELIGIVTRTDIIEEIHEQYLRNKAPNNVNGQLKTNVKNDMKEQLPEEIYTLLEQISKIASRTKTKVYLIGGIVRDILLRRPNEDVDFVVEGDGIQFAKHLHEQLGGELVAHEEFGTATWTAPNGIEVDIASSRLEYYEKPATLPEVERSTLKEDLYRRDFTINAMAVHLNEARFGDLVDPFMGQEDLHHKTIRVLHNLSFVEDPTRILRAVRFEVRFQFKMDEQTEKLALQSMPQMKELSCQRIMNEIKRLYQEENPLEATQRLGELGFWQQFLNGEWDREKVNYYTKKLADFHELFERNQMKKSEMSWFAYFIVPFYAGKRLENIKRFALTREAKKLVRELIEESRQPMEHVETVGDLHDRFKTVSDDTVLLLASCEFFADEKLVLNYLQKRKKLSPLLTGEDLKRRGLPQGPLYQEILSALETAMLNGEVQTKREAEQWLEQFLSAMDDS